MSDCVSIFERILGVWIYWWNLAKTTLDVMSDALSEQQEAGLQRSDTRCSGEEDQGRD